MSLTSDLRIALHEVGVALRRPEEFTTRWRDRRLTPGPRPLIFPVLLANAVLGIAAYGLVMRLHEGWDGMLGGLVKAPVAAGLAWALALPALYILNSALGSKLDASTTLLAALTTVSFGSMALMASIPITWFFGLALPYGLVRLAVNLLVFVGVGICMVDVFLRTMKALEPAHSRAYATLWLALVGVIGAELMTLFSLFHFDA
ncbi:hypothetical protein [Hyalangium versicolor]|uniref:hypothetical protein n=1 Tax=Hyalangium versicolor TaxID=2861190 RepID=UPI001CCCD85D|nr:hypothetical protein [Hyalangium versicolor]